MSTRSLTRVFFEGKQVLNMYRQSDGYPTGHGRDLYDFMKGFIFVNGLGIDTVGEPKLANGAGCFAAQLVAHFKVGAGGIYLVDGCPGDHGQEYDYMIDIPLDPTVQPVIKVRNCRKKVIFTGNVEAFGAFCNDEESDT